MDAQCGISGARGWTLDRIEQRIPQSSFQGLDVSKEKIAVAIADEGRDKPRYWGMIPNTVESTRKLVNKLGEKDNLRVCYDLKLKNKIL